VSSDPGSVRFGPFELDDLDPHGDDVYDDLPPDFPVAFIRDGHKVPDLSELPRERWEEVLRWCAPRVRELATMTTRGQADNVAAQWILFQLHGEEHTRREAALKESAPPPAPPPLRDLQRRSDVRQVNFRVSAAQYEDLERAARAYGVSCPRLAMMLTMRGVRRARGER
jgi:hypothetical protein